MPAARTGSRRSWRPPHTDTAKVKAALDKLEGHEPGPPDDFAQSLADELGVEVSDVRAR